MDRRFLLPAGKTIGYFSRADAAGDADKRGCLVPDTPRLRSPLLPRGIPRQTSGVDLSGTKIRFANFSLFVTSRLATLTIFVINVLKSSPLEIEGERRTIRVVR